MRLIAAVVVSVSGFLSASADDSFCFGVTCIGPNGNLANALMDETENTITFFPDDSGHEGEAIDVKTSLCLVIPPGAHPKIFNSTFGKDCAPTS